MSTYIEEPIAVEIEDDLTESQFRNVEGMLDRPLGRRRVRAHYVFTVEAGSPLAETLCEYLREQGIAHGVARTQRWGARDAARAPAAQPPPAGVTRMRDPSTPVGGEGGGAGEGEPIGETVVHGERERGGGESGTPEPKPDPGESGEGDPQAGPSAGGGSPHDPAGDGGGASTETNWECENAGSFYGSAAELDAAIQAELALAKGYDEAADGLTIQAQIAYEESKDYVFIRDEDSKQDAIDLHKNATDDRAKAELHRQEARRLSKVKECGYYFWASDLAEVVNAREDRERRHTHHLRHDHPAPVKRNSHRENLG